MPKKLKIYDEEPHVVEDYYIGNTHIIICDNYCRKTTEEENNEIWKRVARKAQRYLTEAARRAEKAEQK